MQYRPIRPIFIPDRANARKADCAPGPGVFVLKPNKITDIRSIVQTHLLIKLVRYKLCEPNTLFTQPRKYYFPG